MSSVDVEWIQMHQDRIQQWDFVYVAINILFPGKVEYYLANGKTVRL